jgi:hypothetical protein
VVQPRDDAASGKEKEIDIEEEFTIQERRRIIDMSGMPRLYQRMVKSIAPTIFGHDEIKRGVLLMLFGGVHKETKDRTMLRGDINGTHYSNNVLSAESVITLTDDHISIFCLCQ